MDKEIYIELGYNDRQDYLDYLADDHGVDIQTVLALAELLGEDEDFDGLVNAIEDLSEIY